MLGEELRRYRELLNMSQATLAEGLCSVAHVSRVESGERAVTAELLALWSDRLQVPLVDLTPAFMSAAPSVQQRLAFALQLGKRGYCAEAEDLINKTHDSLRVDPNPPAYLGLVYEARGVVQYLQHRYEDAINEFTLAVSSRSPASLRPYDCARVLFRLGTAYVEAGRLTDAVDSLWRAFKTIQGTLPQLAKVKTAKVVRLHSKIVRNLGVVLLRQGHFGAALQMHDLASGMRRQYGTDGDWEPAIVLNYAVSHIGMGLYTDAMKLLRHLLARRDLDDDTVLNGLTCLGVAQRLSADIGSAKATLARALSVAAASGSVNTRGLYNELTHLALHDGNMEEARRWLTLAEASSADDANLVAETYVLLCRVEEAAQTRGSDLSASMTALCKAREAGAWSTFRQLQVAIEAVCITLASSIPDEAVTSVAALRDLVDRISV